MANKTITIDGQQYNLAELTLDQAEEIFAPERTDLKLQGREAVVCCLQNAGRSDYTLDNIGAMPFPIFATLRQAALELNGLAPQTEGEATAPAKA